MQARGSQDMSMETHEGAPHSWSVLGGPSFAIFSALGDCWAMLCVNMSSTKESQLTLHFISFFCMAGCREVRADDSGEAIRSGEGD